MTIVRLSPGRILPAVFFVLCFSCLTTSATTLADAWKALAANNDSTALQLFTAAAQSGPDVEEALWGKYWVSQIQSDDAVGWSAIRQAMKIAKTRDPYLYAIMSGTTFGYASRWHRQELADLYRDVIAHPDSLGILRGMAYENLGYLYRRSGKVQQAHEMFDSIGAITSWRLLGPFDNISASGYDTRYDPELTSDDVDSSYEGVSGSMVRWFESPRSRRDGWVDMELHFPTAHGIFYGTTYIYIPTAQRLHVRLGTSGSCKLFLDTALVLSSVEEYNNDLDTYIAEMEVPAGWHRILVKCGASEIQRCNFLLRITDARGNRIDGVKYSTMPQATAAAPSSVRSVPNPFVAYFKNRIQQFPNQLENYLFLAQAHLRNDNVEQAEDALLEAQQLAPDAIVVLRLLLDSYSRGSKNDDYASTYEHIKTLRPTLPISILYSFYNDISADRIDEAETKLEAIARVMPNSEAYFDAALAVAGHRNKIQDKMDLQARAYKAYPDNLSYMSSAIVLALQSPGRLASARTILESYLEQEYNDRALSMLASLSLEEGDLGGWRTWYDRIFELFPASPGYYVNMADVYAKRKQFDSAVANVRRALEIAPGVSRYWYNLGSLHQALGNKEHAADAFSTALKSDPSDFSSRDALRDLSGLPSPFSVMPAPNIDSLIASAPSAAAYPEDDAIILHSDVRRVVYDGSRCDVMREELVRIFTKEGIDQFKEYSAEGAGDGEYIVDKAVVRKPGGKEIPADHQAGYFVFKGLEVGDFIYMKTRVREARSGRLAKYFFDAYGFDSYYPVKTARYALLLPKGTAYQWAIANTTIESQSKDTEFGDLTVWEMKDQPAIQSEAYMPDYEVIGKRLQLTSIESWRDIVQWYHALARTKTRSSREIRSVMDSLCPHSEPLDRTEIIERVYRYITSEIRYSNVPFRQSGLIPQKARTVMVTRIGDCKDVATLCIAMLAERNIPAWHVLVETNTSLLIPKRLPGVPFDHAIVCTQIHDTLRFFDLTADNVPMGSLPFADIDAFALPIKDNWQSPIRLSRSMFHPNNIDISTSVTIDALGDAMIEQHVTHTGSRTQLIRSAWKELTRTELEKELKEGLSEQYGDVTLDDVQINHLDDLSPVLDYTLAFTVPAYVVEAGDFRIARIPWRDAFTPDVALSYATREYPIEMGYSRDTVNERIVLNIPDGFEPMGLKPSFERKHAVTSVSMTSAIRNGFIDVTRKSIRYGSVVSTDDYPSYKTFYNDVMREDRRSILFAPKGTVVATPGKSRHGKQPKTGR